MIQYECPFCGAILNTLIGFTSVTETDEYTIDKDGNPKWIAELDTFKDDVKFECVKCYKSTADISDFKVI